MGYNSSASYRCYVEVDEDDSTYILVYFHSKLTNLRKQIFNKIVLEAGNL